ncbi:MAG: ABC transporter permease [Gemmatimonadaceae bacterium]
MPSRAVPRYRRIGVIALREWEVMVRTRTFVAVSLMVPATMIGMAMLPAFILRRQGLQEPDRNLPTSPFMIGLLLDIFLFLGISSQSQSLLRSVLEERGNRMLEILLSSIRPLELLLGKLIGYAMIALTQLGVWILAALMLSSAIGLPFAFRFFHALGWHALPLFLACYAVGYLLYGSLYAIVAAVIGAEREAILYQQLLAILLVLPFVMTVALGTNPHDPLALQLTWVPLMTPTVVLLRWAYHAISTAEIIGALGLAGLAAVGALLVAARLFQGSTLLALRKTSWRAAWNARPVPPRAIPPARSTRGPLPDR